MGDLNRERCDVGPKEKGLNVGVLQSIGRRLSSSCCCKIDVIWQYYDTRLTDKCTTHHGVFLLGRGTSKLMIMIGIVAR